MGRPDETCVDSPGIRHVAVTGLTLPSRRVRAQGLTAPVTRLVLRRWEIIFCRTARCLKQILAVISASMSGGSIPRASERQRAPGPEGNGRLEGEPEVLTSGEAARRLNTTDDTVRSWVDARRIEGWWVQRGQRRRYYVPLTALVAAPTPGRGPRRRTESAPVDTESDRGAKAVELAAIRSELAELRSLIVSRDTGASRSEVLQLRAFVQSLQTAGLRMKAAMDHMSAAKDAQAEASSQMLAAVQEQGEALASFMLPSYVPDADD